ncbi:MAG: hypothetical protein WEB58_16570 [Planctomycetaceae bacterium]
MASSEIVYPWYTVIHNQESLEQGDILQNFEVFNINRAFTSDDAEYDVTLQALDVVVLTQSCDIEHEKARSLVLCPITPLADIIRTASERGEQHWKKTDYLQRLRQGNIPGFHLVSDFDSSEITFPVSVVNFREIYSAPTAQVRDFIGRGQPRLRLCPPYKEHLAQAFARFFMRVGLPIDIPIEKIKASGT